MGHKWMMHRCLDSEWEKIRWCSSRKCQLKIKYDEFCLLCVIKIVCLIWIFNLHNSNSRFFPQNILNASSQHSLIVKWDHNIPKSVQILLFIVSTLLYSLLTEVMYSFSSCCCTKLTICCVTMWASGCLFIDKSVSVFCFIQTQGKRKADKSM